MKRFVIWYLDEADKPHKTNWGSDDLVKAEETVAKIKATGKSRFKKVWIEDTSCTQQQSMVFTTCSTACPDH